MSPQALQHKDRADAAILAAQAAERAALQAVEAAQRDAEEKLAARANVHKQASALIANRQNVLFVQPHFPWWLCLQVFFFRDPVSLKLFLYILCQMPDHGIQFFF